MNKVLNQTIRLLNQIKLEKLDMKFQKSITSTITSSNQFSELFTKKYSVKQSNLKNGFRITKFAHSILALSLLAMPLSLEAGKATNKKADKANNNKAKAIDNKAIDNKIPDSKTNEAKTNNSKAIESKVLDMNKRPEALEAEAFTFPDYKVIYLDNGLKVYVIEDNEQPTFNFSLQFKGGSIVEKKSELANMLAGMFTKGTKKKNSGEIAEQLDQLGLNLSATATDESFIVSGAGLTKNSDVLLSTLSEILTSIDFDNDELEKLVNQSITNLESEKSNPGYLARRMARIALYGANHPYSAVAKAEDFKEIKSNDLKDYFSSYIRPNNASLVIVSNLKSDEVEKRLKKVLSNWEKTEITSFRIPEPKPLPFGVYFVERPGSVQSSIRFVSNTVPFTDGNYDAVDLAVGVMGSGFAGKMFKILREKHSYTYSPNASQTSNHYNFLSLSADVRNNVTDSSIQVLSELMQDMGSNPVSEEEFSLIKTYIAGQFNLSFENSNFIGSMIQAYDFHDRSIELLKNYTKRLNMYSNYDIQRMAATYMNPNKGYWIVVGDPSIKSKLEKFGKVFTYNSTFEKNADFKKVDIEADVIFEKYTDAIGGINQLSAVSSLHSSAEAELFAGGQQIKGSINEYYKSPNKFAQEIDYGFIKTGRRYNGSIGWSLSGDTFSEINGTNLEDLKNESNLFLYTKLKKLAYKLEVIGQQDKNIVVKATAKTGTESTIYFDSQTFLIKRIESIQSTNEGDIPVLKIIEEYTKVGELTLPKIVRLEGLNYKMRLNYQHFINTIADDTIFEKK